MKKLILIAAAVAALAGCKMSTHGDVVKLKNRSIDEAIKNKELEVAKEKNRAAEIEAKKARERAEIEAKKARERADIDKQKELETLEREKRIEELKAEQERLRAKWLEDLKKRYAVLLDTNGVEKLDFQSEIAWAEKPFVNDFGEFPGDMEIASRRRGETLLRAEYARLLRLQRDGKEISQEGWTNIVVGAVAVGRLNVLKWAFPHVKDIDIVSKLDSLDRTPLLWALGGQDAELLDNIWKLQPNIDVRDAELSTPLHYAMRRGSLPDVERCLMLKPEMVNLADTNGVTPLYCAIAMSRLDLAQRLLNTQANVQLQSKDGLSPFAYACERGELAFLELLERHGAKPTVEDFAKAIAREHLELVKWFVEKRHFSVNDNKVCKAVAGLKEGSSVRMYLLKRGAAVSR